MGKVQPTGICDYCLGPIPQGEWYKVHPPHDPRLYCSIDCRNAANSRAGSAGRKEKARNRVAVGDWVNPATINPPQKENVAAGVRRARLREVAEGRWRNPGLTPEAREINSQPHKHSGALASAIEKLKSGLHIADLTEEEKEAHRAYRRSLRKKE